MLTTSEVAKASGVPASTLRYYEECGLVESIGRHGLQRTFETSVLERLALIALGRGAGFSLDEIGHLFRSSKGMDIDRDKLREKADELDQMIDRLVVIRDSLRSTAACPAPSHMECPNFRRVMRSAARGLIPPLQPPVKPQRKAGR